MVWLMPRFASPIAVLVSVAVLLSACDGSGAPEVTSSSSTTSVTTTLTTAPSPPATLAVPSGVVVITGGTIVTMDGTADAEAMVVSDGLIDGVGNESDMLELAGEGAVVVDLGGRFVFPGFIDSHSHWYQPNRLGDYTPEQVNQILLSRGWTGTNEVNLEPHFADDFFTWHEEGRIDLRMNAYLSVNTPGADLDRHGDWFSERGITPGTTFGGRLRVPGVKIFIASDWDRFVKWTQDELTAEVAKYHDQGWQIAAKQISDGSLDMALEAFEAVFTPGEDRRHRLEHALELRTDQIPRVAALDLVPIVQLGAIESDFQHEEGFAEQLSNDGIERAWPFQEMAQAGLPLVGSIAVAPLEGLRDPFTISVMQMLHGALTGISEIGNTPWPGRESELMDIDQALDAITSLAAWSTFEEDTRGTLTAGKLADFVIFSDDLRLGGADPELLRSVTVDATFIDGELLWCGFGLDDWCANFGQPIPERILFRETLTPLGPGETNPEAPSESSPPQPVDGSLIQAVTASNGQAGLINAFDGDEETSWTSGAGPPQWVELDLGQPVAVDRLRLLVDQYPSGRSVHQIFGGDQSDPSEMLVEVSGETEWGQLLEVDIGQTVRYLRILTVESPSWVSWLEIEVVSAP